MTRRGVTLLELALAIALLGLLSVSIGGVLALSAAAGRRASAGLDRDRLLLAVGTLLRHDLADGASGSTTVTAPTRLAFDRPVGEARACGDSPGSVAIPTDDWRGDRWPAGGRDVAVVLPDSLLADWRRVPILATSGTACADGRAALALSLGGSVPGARYVRVVEPVRLNAYASGGDDWLGLAPGDGTGVVQPFAGPLDRAATTFEQLSDRVRLQTTTAAGTRVRLEIPLDVRW